MKTRGYLVLLLFAIFFVSVGFSFYADISPHADAKAYNHIAWNLVRGFGYLEDEDLLKKNIDPAEIHKKDDAIFRVGPGYEFFLAGIYGLKGFDPVQDYASPDMWRAVWISHALLRVLTALLLFKIAILLFPDHPKKELIGLAAAALFGFFPDLLLMNAFLLYETLLLFLGVAAVYFSLQVIARFDTSFRATKPHSSSAILSRHIDISRYRDVLLASLFWALAILTRPSELLAFFVFPLVLAFTWRLHRQGLILAGISFLFPLLLVGGWALRNSLLYNQPLFTTTAGAYALWVGNNEKATGGYDRPPELKEARNRYHSTALSSIAIKRVFQFAKERPLKFIELQIRKTATYFSFIRPTGFWPEFENTPTKRFVIVASSALATLLLFLGGTAGAWLLWTKKNYLMIALYGFMLAKPLAVIPLYVETRYRYNLYPLFALTAAFFLINFVTSPKRAAFIKVMTGVLAAFLVITSIDAWFSLDIIINKLPAIFPFS